jgi:hypothetical protein
MSLPNDLHQHTLPASAVKLAVEYLLPGAEIQLTVSYSHDDLTSHDLAFEVSVPVVLAGSVMVEFHPKKMVDNLSTIDYSIINRRVTHNPFYAAAIFRILGLYV